MNNKIVKFLELKPVVDYSFSDSSELVFKLYRDSGSFEVKKIQEIKAFKEYGFIKKQKNKILCYDKNNELIDIFEVMPDNTIFKMLENNKKIDILDIEKDIENIVDKFDLIEFEEPITIKVPKNLKEQKRGIKNFFRRK